MVSPAADALGWLLKLESHAPAWAEATAPCAEGNVVLHVPVFIALPLERAESVIIVEFVSGLGTLVRVKPMGLVSALLEPDFEMKLRRC